MQMNVGVDTGQIVAQAPLKISKNDSFLTLRDKLVKLGSSQLIETIPQYLSGQVKLIEQDNTATTVTTKLTKDAGEIDWSQDVNLIDRQIRALNPWPGTFTRLDGQNFKILEAELVGSKLLPHVVTLEGKKAMSWVDFQNGYAERLKKQSWWGKIA